MLKNQKAFTLVEMLFVLLIISILIILIVPHLSSRSENIQDQGCDALVQIVQTQVDTYYLNEKELPESIDALVKEDYITSTQKSCANGKELTLSEEGVVRVGSSGR